jgi:hypothetical protein
MFEKIEKIIDGRSKSSFKPVPLKAAFVCDQSKKIIETFLSKVLPAEIVFRYKDKTLVIKAPHLWAYELELRKDQIEERVKDRFGEKVVREVRIRTI